MWKPGKEGVFEEEANGGKENGRYKMVSEALVLGVSRRVFFLHCSISRLFLIS